MKLRSQYLFSGNELSPEEIVGLMELGLALKKDNTMGNALMQGKHLALLFEKPSLRTRFSFTVAMQQLGGHVVESVSESRKPEDPEDHIRVIQNYCDVLMIRTHDDHVFEKMQPVSRIPIINGLSELYHPCQTLADLLTLLEVFKTLQGLSIAYVGDGNNILHSLLLMAPKVGVNVHYSCPAGAEPNPAVVQLATSQATTGSITAYATATETVKNCHAVYTDVWTSMGCSQRDNVSFEGYQVNEALMQHARADAVFMHCMPMEKGKEISKTLPEQPCSVIFQQSGNRLYAQKALLMSLDM